MVSTLNYLQFLNLLAAVIYNCQNQKQNITTGPELYKKLYMILQTMRVAGLM